MSAFFQDLTRLLTLQDATTRIVLVGTGLLGLACGVIGSFGVLRRRSLVSDAVAHAALPGIAAAFFITNDRNFFAFLLGALVFGLLAACLISLIRTYTRVKEDAAIGVVIGSFFGLGIVWSRIIQNRPTGNRAGIDSFIFGKAASMVGQDATLIAIVATLCLVTVALLFKELKLLCFDRAFAASQGWPALTLDLLIMLMLCICTVVGLPAVGVVMIVALMIIPAVTARFWTDRLSMLLLIAGTAGLLAGVLGTALSATLPAPAHALSRGWPTGPLIVLVAAAMFLASMLFAPKRGILAEAARRRNYSRKVRLQHALVDLLTTTPASDSSRYDSRTLARARRMGLVSGTHSNPTLTNAGLAEASRVHHAHQLWQLFLIQEASIAPDHVDRDADELEHVLPPELLARLEAQLSRTSQAQPTPDPIQPDQQHEQPSR
jgi:manganese/zinc/iron transport system permease protein